MAGIGPYMEDSFSELHPLLYPPDGYFGIKIGIKRAMACLAARIHLFRRRERKVTKCREKEKRITLWGRLWSA